MMNSITTQFLAMLGRALTGFTEIKMSLAVVLQRGDFNASNNSAGIQKILNFYQYAKGYLDVLVIGLLLLGGFKVASKYFQGEDGAVKIILSMLAGIIFWWFILPEIMEGLEA